MQRRFWQRAAPISNADKNVQVHRRLAPIDFRMVSREPAAFSPTMPANRPAKRTNKRGESRPNIALCMVRYVAIIAVPPARMLDVVGPAEVFADANKLHGGQ